MTAIAHKAVAFELRIRDQVQRRGAGTSPPALRATEDGWSLLAPSGEVLFRGLGLGGRRQCLEFAHELGVLAVLS